MIRLLIKILIIYLAAMNIAGFAVMGLDKRKAVRHGERIPEKTLFFIAAAGGSLGSLLGMYAFRHKTKHLRFVVGIPVILVLQIILVYYLIKYIP